MKEKLNFSNEYINDLDLDAKSFFKFSVKEIVEMEELTQEEKDNYKNYLKQEKRLEEINEKQNEEKKCCN